ncbi:PTS sugar transporter subunit IIC [Oceanivirga miroungae]|uniref:Phosphotransferase system EIIC domain-containing protein n=1 Tax=Oceanivirga miroungae TaxID=1130046 RepID=A0A6I8MCD7_9FUSO|nr:PTS sugar transporter subunit IIC [Oceanivirga miroungae]VWL84826.1 hypothetical protein OMES3154_00080 [Oceanivirga miroungae]
MSKKLFIKKVLDGLALAIVVALIPNAVLGAILKPYAANAYIKLFIDSMVIMQGLCAALVGLLVGLQFGFNPMKSTIIGAATFISSGVISFNAQAGMYKMAGIGDLINVTLFAAVAVLVTMYLDNKLGSLTIIFQPIIVGAGVGFLGLLALPYVAQITKSIGDLILYFTNLQPLMMSILITISFAIIIISPISTVAIAYAIGLTGLSSGAANMGVTVTAAVLVVGSIAAKNKSGITLAALFGAMKMFFPNIVENPIMYLPIIVTSIASGITVRVVGILGNKASAGFGIVGLVGPIEAYNQFVSMGTSLALVRLVIAYLIVPFGVAIITHFLFTKVFKLYSSDIYKFEN